MTEADKRGDATVHLLSRVRRREPTAMDELLRHVWPRVERWIRRERGDLVRLRYDTIDCAQDVALSLVEYLPDIAISDRETFQRILYRMIQNSLHNKRDYLMARRRRLTAERPLATDASVDLDIPCPGTSPTEYASREEERAWVRVGLALLAPDDQELIYRRQYDDQPFADIGESLGLSPDAARMRFQRALVRLNSLVNGLRRGRARSMFAGDGESSSSEPEVGSAD